jgi:ribosomal protein L17
MKTPEWSPPQRPNGFTPLPLRNSTLTELESRELEQSEAIIQNGWRHFLEVGQALMKIQKNKLYREGYATFEVYCRDRLGISRPYAYNLIGSAEVFEDLSSIEDIPSKPANEAQTRYLIGLAKEHRIAAWKKALEKAGVEPVTAKLVRDVAFKFKQNKTVKARLKHSLKEAANGESTSNPILRLLDETEEAVNLKDFYKAQKFLQRLRETICASLSSSAGDPSSLLK